MPKFLVTLEKSASIGVKIMIEAEDADDADDAAQQWADNNRDKIDGLILDLLDVPDLTIQAYAEKVQAPFAGIYVSEGDLDFEVFDIEDV